MVVIVAIFSALVNKDAFDDSEKGERRKRLYRGYTNKTKNIAASRSVEAVVRRGAALG